MVYSGFNQLTKLEMKKTIFYIAMAMLCLNFGARAQSGGEKTILPLQVGFKVPADFWNIEHLVYQNGNTIKENLSKHKDKLIILDFWATWCSTCINKFKGLEELQQVYGNKIKIILVNTKDTRDDEFKIDRLFSGQINPAKKYTLPSIYMDTYINTLFPHGFTPFYIIINPGGEVRAILPSILVTNENIALLLGKSKTQPIFKN